MAIRWIGVALIAGCLAGATEVRAQCMDSYCPAKPCCGASYNLCPLEGPTAPGPITPQIAPCGPGQDLSLRGDTANAWTVNPCCDCCKGGPCCCPDGMWFSVEALYWVLQNPRLPGPMITANGTGVPGGPGVLTVVGSDTLAYNPFVGGRANVGFWLNSDRTVSLEMTGFILEKDGTHAGAQSDPAGNPPIFVDHIVAGTLTDAPVALSPGGAFISASSRLWGAEANLVLDSCECCGGTIALIGGFRYADLNEVVNIFTNTAAATTRDHFLTRNQFTGGQFGIRAVSAACGKLFFGVESKIAGGRDHESIIIDGSTTTAAGTTPGGAFATASNIGHFNRDEYSFISESQLKVGIKCNQFLMLYAGYDFFYWNQLQRAADQIDRQVGTVNGVTFPQVPFHQTYLWAQGIEAGFELRF